MGQLSTPTQELQAGPRVSHDPDATQLDAKQQRTLSMRTGKSQAQPRRAVPDVELPPYGQETGSGLIFHRKEGEIMTPDASGFCLAKLTQYLATLCGG